MSAHPSKAARHGARRSARRVGTLAFAAALAGLVVTAAGPARATDGLGDPANWSPFVAFAVFGLIPLAVAALVWAIVYGTRSRHDRYRPGLVWDYAPQWFGAPDDPDAALDAVETGRSVAAGGSSATW